MNVTKLLHFHGHNDAVYSLCRGSASNEFYSGAGDGYVVCWDAEKGGDGRLLVRVNRPVYSLCLDAEQGLLYCGAASGNLHVIDLSQRKEVRNIEAHGAGVFDIMLQGDLLLTGGGDGHIAVWSRTDLKLLHRLDQAEKSARSLSLNPSGTCIAAGFSDHKIRLYAVPDFSLLDTFDAHRNSVFSVAFTDDSTLLSGGRDAFLKRWRLFEPAALDELPAHTLHINHIALSPGKNLFVTASMDKTLKVWDLERMTLLKVIDFARHGGHRSSVNRCLWISERSFLSCSDDRSVMLWRIDN